MAAVETPRLHIPLDREGNAIEFKFEDSAGAVPKSAKTVLVSRQHQTDINRCLEDLDRFIRTDHTPTGWIARLRAHTNHLSQELFRDGKLKATYDFALASENEFNILVEENPTAKDPAKNVISSPLEFWDHGDDIVLLKHPSAKRIMPPYDTPYPAYEPMPSVIVLIAGGPDGEPSPTATNHVKQIVGLLAQRGIDKHARIVAIPWGEATKSRILSVLRQPLDGVPSESKTNGFVHWVSSPCKKPGNDGGLEFLRVRDEILNEPVPLSLGDLEDALKESVVDWQFFFLSSYVEMGKDREVEYPDGLGGVAGVLRRLVLDARIPAVLGFLRPVWRAEARNLSTEFYDHLFGGDKVPLLSKALLEARRVIKEDTVESITGCPFAWVAPVLIWQHQESAKKIDLSRPEESMNEEGDSSMDPNVQIAVAAAIWLWSVLKSSAEGFSKKVGEKLGEKSVEAVEELITSARNEDNKSPQPIDNDPSVQRERLIKFASKMAVENRKRIEQAANVWGLLSSLLNEETCIAIDDLHVLVDTSGASRGDWGEPLSRPNLVRKYIEWLKPRTDKAEIVDRIFKKLNPVLPSK